MLYLGNGVSPNRRKANNSCDFCLLADTQAWPPVGNVRCECGCGRSA